LEIETKQRELDLSQIVPVLAKTLQYELQSAPSLFGASVRDGIEEIQNFGAITVFVAGKYSFTIPSVEM
jgi:hypothetical protein